MDFRKFLTSLRGQRIVACQLQDPYLLNRHPMDCLTEFLRAVEWPPGDTPVTFRLVTQQAERDSRVADSWTPTQQKQELSARLSAIKVLRPSLDIRPRKRSALHMRFAHFKLRSGQELLYILERGLDISAPQTKTARDNTYILEFPSVPPELRSVLRV